MRQVGKYMANVELMYRKIAPIVSLILSFQLNVDFKLLLIKAKTEVLSFGYNAESMSVLVLEQTQEQ